MSAVALVASVAVEGQAVSSDALEEVVVQAQKRSENLQQVPLTVTAITGAELASSGVTNSMELNDIVAGLNIRTQVGSFQPSIRGISTSSSVVENPVALYIDDVYIPQQREGVRPLGGDIDQIAVLKGPQGTLFGRNATAGVIQITTRTPTREFAAQVQTSLDNYLTSQNDVYINGGLSDKVAANFSGYFDVQGRGWGKDLITGDATDRIIRQYGFTSKVLIEASDSTSIIIGTDYTDRALLSNDVIALPGTYFNLPNAIKQPVSNPWDDWQGFNGRLGYHGGGISAKVTSDLPFASFKSITSYRQGSGMLFYDDSGGPPISATELNQLAYSPDAPSRDWTEELQLLSPRAGSVTWAAGLFYFHNENGAAPLIKWFGGPSAPLPTSTVYWVDRAKEVTNSIAPFGQLSWKFLTDNELTLGVRYTEEKRKFDGSLTTTARNGVVKDAPYASSVFLEKTTYRVALTHNFSADTLAYASVNSGVKSGGFNVFNPPNPGYQPEKITAYEAGFKSELLNRTLRLNASGFYYDYTNIQVNQLIGGSAFILNGPGASIYGTDIDIEAQVMHGLRFTSGIELLHANFTDYHNAVVGKPNPAGGVLQVTGDATGNRLPLAQNYAVTTALDYSVDGSYGTFHAAAGADFNGDYFFEADNFLRQKAYINVNASLDWTPSSGRYTVTLFSRNMLNNAVLTQANTTGLGYLALYEFPPRTYGASLLVKF